MNPDAPITITVCERKHKLESSAHRNLARPVCWRLAAFDRSCPDAQRAMRDALEMEPSECVRRWMAGVG